MRVLVIGRGPVARMLLSVLPEGIDAWAGLRTGADRLDIATARARRGGRGAVRRRSVPAIDVTGAHPPAGEERWDAVITTASPRVNELRRVLAGSPGALLAAVSQTPGDVVALRRAAAGLDWVVAVPEFLATREDPVRWWGPGGLAFALAGPGASRAASLLRGAARTRRTGVRRVLEQAALVIPVVAGFRIGGERWSGLLAELPAVSAASAQARAAVASARRSSASTRSAGPAPAGRVTAAEAAALRAGLAVALRVAPTLVPIDLERYMRTHFGRHTGQTLRMLDEWSELGAAAGLPVDAIVALRERFATTLGG